MKTHHKQKPPFILLLTLLFFATNSYAIDNSQTDRSRVVAPRNDRFNRNDRVRKYINFSGEYESDQNSKQYVVSTGHFYRSNKWINETDFLYQKDYSQKSANNYELKPSSELYDFQMSSKIVIPDTQDYIVLYTRDKYNPLSTYYYDLTNAAGVGRMFFDDLFEIDVAIGHSEVKEYDQKTTLIPSFRAEFDIWEKLHFIQRGYMYFSDEANDYQMRTRLQYPIGKQLYLQVSYDTDKRTYTNKAKHEKVNEVHRRIVFGFRYDLGSN